jgi:hypothetical protein
MAVRLDFAPRARVPLAGKSSMLKGRNIKLITKTFNSKGLLFFCIFDGPKPGL